MSERDIHIAAFLEKAGWDEADRHVLAADASFRRYDRITRRGETAILMDAPPPKEDIRPFARVARHLTGCGYSAPEILAEDESRGFLLLEDFGDDTFTRLLQKGETEDALYQLATDMLIDLHGRADDAILSGLPDYDDELMLAEAALLTEWYAPTVLPGGLSAAQKVDYRDRWSRVLPAARQVPDTLVLRDFHVDNLMRLKNRDGIAACGLLDFQDAVIGPVTYDLMSLLEDARRDVSADIVAAMRARYLAAFPGIDPADFDASMAVLGAQRHAKVIGIFTRLCHRDGKANYLQHIPRVWRLLETACAHPVLAPVRDWIDEVFPGESRVIPDKEKPA